MKQIWLISYNAPDNVQEILSKALSELSKPKGIHYVPFGMGVMTDEEEDIIADYIYSVVPAINLDDVYFNYDW